MNLKNLKESESVNLMPNLIKQQFDESEIWNNLDPILLLRIFDPEEDFDAISIQFVDFVHQKPIFARSFLSFSSLRSRSLF